MGDASFGDVIVRNIRAARARRNLEQGTVVGRMNALGFTNWHRQTLSKIERGERRLLAEELLALAEALGTSVRALLLPTDDDKQVQFPSGGAIEARSVMRSVMRGINDGSVQWDGTVARIGSPVYPPGVNPAFDAWPAGEGEG